MSIWIKSNKVRTHQVKLGQVKLSQKFFGPDFLGSMLPQYMALSVSFVSFVSFRL